MATTTQGEQLTEAHRKQQVANAAAAALLIERLWATNVDPAALAATFARFLELALPLITARRDKSALIAANYASLFRSEEFRPLLGRQSARSRLTFTPVGEVSLDKLTTSLHVVGELPSARATRLLGQSPELDRKVKTLFKDAGRAASAASFRHVADGGRETLRDITTGQQRQDAAVVGYQRVTKAKPCYFCALLASRGPVSEDNGQISGLYRPDSFAQSDARFTGPGGVKVHDSCACSLEPVYSSTSNWAGNARTFADQWEASDGTIIGFRRLYEGRAAREPSDSRL